MTLVHLLGVVVLAALGNNFVFTRFLGVESMVNGGTELKAAGTVGGVVAFSMAVSAALFWPVDNWVLSPLDLSYLRTVVCVLLCAVVAHGALRLLDRISPETGRRMKGHTAITMANSAVLGAALLVSDSVTSFGMAVVWGVSSGLGFLGAMLLYTGVGMRLEFSGCPRAFRGLPIALISMGLLALAFEGFAGV